MAAAPLLAPDISELVEQLIYVEYRANRLAHAQADPAELEEARGLAADLQARIQQARRQEQGSMSPAGVA